jgi:hypothetical protein
MFAPASIDLAGGFSIPAPLDKAFEFFSPLGEMAWVPGWDPELLHPPGVSWARGLIFRTQEERGEARAAAHTEVGVTYTFVGLSDTGNRDIAAMSQAAFDEKMTRWQRWIGKCLA